ncbi:LysM peptidoglycan-binding domain-containing protein [Fibrella sp. HMF5335]|uniref:LysM peptidoglycan-binding domain-containing protein n=1 Tax=Fibrella rubiginis TaxID=2817060 RepID=A0A939GJH8_9BACT|nr:lytic transglycosylase domain-containing protein [Fibrella rubiginis]MBO0938938.1 LysM peptidoglycan-binding domain-containing protein [Fibrella rubiginis]
MKRLFTLLFSLVSLLAMAQPAPVVDRPTVPDQVTFADLTVRFDDDARRLIQQDVNSLMANRGYWYAKLDRALLYFPLMENALLTDQMPTDFKYLAMQESSLTPDAVSSSQAVGFWQFKRETANDYGLTVNDQVDERKHILSSTHAAARYLRRSNGMYSNWVSALFSFYLGTGGISKIISPDWASAKDITLSGSTDRYVLRFFAHKLAIEHAVKTYQPSLPFALVEYPGGGGKNVNDIATELNIPVADIRSYNRWLLTDQVPVDKAYILTVPIPNGQINDVRQRIVATTDTKLKNIPTDDIGFPVLKQVTMATKSDNEPILYEINGLPGVQAQANDNSASLARKSKISLSSFLRFNELSERDLLVPGEVYYLAKKRKKALVPFHTARPDESMRSISQRYGIRLKKLVRYNRMDRVQKLQVGRVLWLREKRPSKTPVEVINAPTPPVYDPSPATPSNRPVVDKSAGDARTAINNIPRNASERKRYQPKLVGSATPDAELTPAKQNQQRNDPSPLPPMTRPAGNPAAANTPPVNVPAPSPTPSVTVPAPDMTATTPIPRDAGSPQRTIIVRAEGEPERQHTTPARSGTGGREVVARNQQRNDPDPLPPMTRPVATATTTYPTTPDPTASQPGKRSASGRRTVDMGEEQPPVTKKGQETPMRNQPYTDPNPLPPMTRPATPADNVPNSRTATAPRTEAPRSTTPGSRTVASPGNSRSVSHTVEAGQTFYSLSRYYGVRVEDLLEANALTLDDKLAVGQKLTVPNVPIGYPTGQPTTSKPVVAAGQPDEPTPAPQAVSTPANGSGPTYHTVVKGETLYRVSKQYEVTVEQLMEWNKLHDMGVKEGQKLRVSQ